MKKLLAVTPEQVLNIYSCKPMGGEVPPGMAGFAYFPWEPEAVLHGVTVDPGVLPKVSDSCPGHPGTDDVGNFMNYANDDCWSRFTPGQAARMTQVLDRFRPGLSR